MDFFILKVVLFEYIFYSLYSINLEIFKKLISVISFRTLQRTLSPWFLLNLLAMEPFGA